MQACRHEGDDDYTKAEGSTQEKADADAICASSPTQDRAYRQSTVPNIYIATSSTHTSSSHSLPPSLLADDQAPLRRRSTAPVSLSADLLRSRTSIHSPISHFSNMPFLGTTNPSLHNLMSQAMSIDMITHVAKIAASLVTVDLPEDDPLPLPALPTKPNASSYEPEHGHKMGPGRSNMTRKSARGKLPTVEEFVYRLVIGLTIETKVLLNTFVYLHRLRDKLPENHLKSKRTIRFTIPVPRFLTLSNAQSWSFSLLTPRIYSTHHMATPPHLPRHSLVYIQAHNKTKRHRRTSVQVCMRPFSAVGDPCHGRRAHETTRRRSSMHQRRSKQGARTVLAVNRGQLM